MLFTAPAFVFLFLPLAMLFYCIFGKKRKRLCIGIICAVYHIMLNMSSPEHFLWLPLLILYSFCAAELCAQKKSRAGSVVLGIVPIVWLVVMRQLAYYEGHDIYPVGITMPALCAAAYIFDSAKEQFYVDGTPKLTRFLDLWLYLTFFPLMILGPFISFDKFLRLTSDDEMSVSLYRTATGARLFATGFIKRIAVGAVLIEGYAKIFAYSWESPNLAIILFLLIILYFGVFFTVSGYYDMSVGLCRLFGMDVPEVDANPFKVATVNEYSKALFGNIREWSDRYVVSPLCESMGKPSGGFLRITACCICTIIFIRSDLTALALSIPLIAFCCASAVLKLDKSHKGGRTGLRMLFGMLTVLVMGTFWVFITIGGSDATLAELVEQISFENAEYQMDMVLISFSPSKYLFVSVMGLLLLLPSSRWAVTSYGKMPKKLKAIMDYGSMILLLAMFVFTIVFFLTGAERYNTAMFDYIII